MRLERLTFTPLIDGDSCTHFILWNIHVEHYHISPYSNWPEQSAEPPIGRRGMHLTCARSGGCHVALDCVDSGFTGAISEPELTWTVLAPVSTRQPREAAPRGEVPMLVNYACAACLTTTTTLVCSPKPLTISLLKRCTSHSSHSIATWYLAAHSNRVPAIILPIK